MAKKKSKAIAGKFHIVEMDQWDADYINMETRGYIQFSKSGYGDFHFGCVRAQMDCDFEARDGGLSVEFTFEGSDEMTPMSGRGRATLDGSTLKGHIYFHQGEDSGFVSKCAPASRSRAVNHRKKLG